MSLNQSAHQTETEITHHGKLISDIFWAIDTIPEMGFGMTLQTPTLILQQHIPLKVEDYGPKHKNIQKHRVVIVWKLWYQNVIVQKLRYQIMDPNTKISTSTL